jgi:hypothetical protein
MCRSSSSYAQPSHSFILAKPRWSISGCSQPQSFPISVRPRSARCSQSSLAHWLRCAVASDLFTTDSQCKSWSPRRSFKRQTATRFDLPLRWRSTNGLVCCMLLVSKLEIFLHVFLTSLASANIKQEHHHFSLVGVSPNSYARFRCGIAPGLSEARARYIPGRPGGGMP